MNKKPLKSFRRSGQEQPNTAPVIDLSNKPQTKVPEATEVNQELLANSYEMKHTLGDIKQDTKHIEDQVAASELIEESVSSLKEPITDSNQKLGNIYDKLSEFSERLKDSFKQELSENPLVNSNPSESTAVAIISQQEEPTDRVIELLELIREDVSTIVTKISSTTTPQFPGLPNLPGAEEEPTSEDKPGRKRKPKKDDDKGFFGVLIDRVGGLISKGFAGTTKALDGISKTLFQYSLSAAINAAKFAAMVFSIVLAIDVLTVLFEKWSREITEDINAFMRKYGALGDVIQTLINATTDLKNYWVKGQYGNFIAELGRTFGSVIDTLIDSMLYQFDKMMAGILRAVGLDSAADTVEGRAAVSRMDKGYALDEQEKALASKYLEEERETKKKIGPFGKILAMNKSWTPSGMQKAGEAYDKNEPDLNVTSEQGMTARELTGLINRLVENSKSNNTSTEAQDRYIGALDRQQETIEIRRESNEITQKDYERLTNKISEERNMMLQRREEMARLYPAPVKDNQDNIRTDSIETEQAKAERKPEEKQQANVNTNTNVVNKKVTNIVQNPVTATPAPGLGGSYK